MINKEKFKEFEEMWGKLRNTPIDEDENIDVDFLHFPKGTFREDIWHWAEEKYDISIGKYNDGGYDNQNIREGYQIVDREDEIDSLIRWIAETESSSDKELMKADLEQLLSWTCKNIYSSEDTNEYIEIDDENGNAKTPLEEEFRIVDEALDNYHDVLKELVTAIQSNIDDNDMVSLQYIADELEEAENLVKQEREPKLKKIKADYRHATNIFNEGGTIYYKKDDKFIELKEYEEFDELEQYYI